MASQRNFEIGYRSVSTLGFGNVDVSSNNMSFLREKQITKIDGYMELWIKCINGPRRPGRGTTPTWAAGFS